MKEYEVSITEEMISRVTVEAENESDAYHKALELLNKGFCAPYHDRIEVTHYEVEEMGEIEIE